LRICAPPISTEPSAKIALHLTHYCVVRRDLSPGLQAANLIHATGESSPGCLPKGTYAVALTAAGETELRDLHARLSAACIPHATIIETDGEHAGQLMAIGAAPGDRARLRRYFSSLPLVGKQPKEVRAEAA
jgi:hypothetical protein